MSNRILARAAAIAALATALAVPAGAEQPEDAWITTKVKMTLLTDDLVDGLDIRVDTFDGKVTLHGQASSETEKARAEERAAAIKGVREVRNLVAVVPDPARDATEVADDALKAEVETALSNDPMLAKSDVSVKSVNDGVVVLSGDADTLSAHRRALEDARSVEGVRTVASEIRSPDELGDAEIWQDATASEGAVDRASRMAYDGWITTKAKLLLMREPGLSPLAVNVDTYRGVVTLFGSVSTEDARNRAGSEVAGIEGVKSVENELQVVPDVAAEAVQTEDAEIRAAVEQRIGERESLQDAAIGVEVSNRVVRLTGDVNSQRDRVTALTTARATDGVNSVVDDLRLAKPKGDS